MRRERSRFNLLTARVTTSDFASAAGGQGLAVAASCNIVNGAITTNTSGGSCKLADTSSTNPSGLCYTIVITDNTTGLPLQGTGYQCYQPSGGSMNFDAFIPNNVTIPQQTLTGGSTLVLGQIAGTAAPGNDPRFSQITVNTNNIAALNAKTTSAATTTGGVTGAQMAVYTARFGPRNLITPSTVVTNYLINAGNGALESYPQDYNMYVSDFFPVTPGGSVSANFATAVYGHTNYGYTFYDAGQNFISGVGGVAANASVSVPMTAVYARYTSQIQNGAISGLVVFGNLSQPGHYVYPGSSPEASAAILSASSGLSGTEFGAYRSKQANTENLYNPLTVTTNQVLRIYDQAYTGIGTNYFSTDYMAVIPGFTVVCNNDTAVGQEAHGDYGWVWFDKDKNFLSGTVGVPSNTPVQVPAGAFFGIVSFNSQILSLPLIINNGSTITPTVAQQALAAVSLPLSGKKVAFVGDSITAIYGQPWLSAVIMKTGMTEVFQDAHTGRQTSQIFENYGGDPVNGKGQGGNGWQNTWADGVSRWAAAGKTLTQDLTAAAPDVVMIYLGHKRSGPCVKSRHAGRCEDHDDIPRLPPSGNRGLSGCLPHGDVLLGFALPEHADNTSSLQPARRDATGDGGARCADVESGDCEQYQPDELQRVPAVR